MDREGPQDPLARARRRSISTLPDHCHEPHRAHSGETDGAYRQPYNDGFGPSDTHWCNQLLTVRKASKMHLDEVPCALPDDSAFPAYKNPISSLR